MRRQAWGMVMRAVVGMMLLGCGSVSVPPPPGLDSGGKDAPGDPGTGDGPGQDRAVDAAPDPGQDVAPPTCSTHEDCQAMPGLGPCIVGRCDPDTGTCWRVMLADGADCEDGDPCTDPDWCVEGQCVGQPKVCDDHNPCTQDFCTEAGLCDANPVPGSCDDGDACTGPDQCADGVCVGPKVICNDNDPCTTDECDPSFGCLFNLLPNCKPCQSDQDCEDGNPCTDNRCVLNQCGSTPLPDGTLCDDSDPCSGDSRCQGGLCKATVFKICDDHNPCTADFCNEQGLCTFLPQPGATCDDKNPCTVSDFCDASGQCVGKPANCDDGNICTNDYCLPPKLTCPGALASAEGAYQCCHEGCSQPNPDCTPTGCRCGGKGDLVCDPVTADNCAPGPLPGVYECKCGLGVACKKGYCCIGGQCQQGGCLDIPT